MITEGVSILISTYNWHNALELSLSSLLIQTVLPNEIIIADDGSTEATRILIHEFQKKTTIPIIHCWQEDNGFRLSLARNNALAVCNYSYVIQIDGDIICHKNFIEDHLFYSQKGIFLCGRRCELRTNDTKKTLENKALSISQETLKTVKLYYKKRNKFFFSFFRFQFINNLIHTGIQGCNMSYWLEDALAINGYNNNIEGWGKEDNEFILRLSRYGLKRKTLKFGAIAYHLEHKHNMTDINNLKENEGILEQVSNSKDVIISNGIKKIQ